MEHIMRVCAHCVHIVSPADWAHTQTHPEIFGWWSWLSVTWTFILMWVNHRWQAFVTINKWTAV